MTQIKMSIHFRLTPSHTGSHTTTFPHIPSNPLTLDYAATATNTQTTRYYTHITRCTHCSRINLSLHIPPMLQANTRHGSI